MAYAKAHLRRVQLCVAEISSGCACSLVLVVLRTLHSVRHIYSLAGCRFDASWYTEVVCVHLFISVKFCSSKRSWHAWQPSSQPAPLCGAAKRVKSLLYAHLHHTDTATAACTQTACANPHTAAAQQTVYTSRTPPPSRSCGSLQINVRPSGGGATVYVYVHVPSIALTLAWCQRRNTTLRLWSTRTCMWITFMTSCGFC